MCVHVRVKWVKVFGENVRKAAGGVDTSLKAADESFRGIKNREISWRRAFSSTMEVDSCLLSSSVQLFFFLFT